MERAYDRVWDDHWGWRVVVRVARDGRQPTGKGEMLWRRRWGAGIDGWRTRYDWVDEWGVLRSSSLHRLAADLLADALDAPKRHSFAAGVMGPHIAGHFTADVLTTQLGDGPWRRWRREILSWLDLHSYLQPAT